MSSAITLPISEVTSVSSADGTVLTLKLTAPSKKVGDVTLPPIFPFYVFEIADPSAEEVAAYVHGNSVTLTIAPAPKAT